MNGLGRPTGEITKVAAQDTRGNRAGTTVSTIYRPVQATVGWQRVGQSHRACGARTGVGDHHGEADWVTSTYW